MHSLVVNQLRALQFTGQRRQEAASWSSDAYGESIRSTAQQFRIQEVLSCEAKNYTYGCAIFGAQC